MKQLRLCVLGFAVLFLPSCQAVQDMTADLQDVDMPSLSSSEPQAEEFLLQGNCPSTEVVKELDVLNEFTDANNPVAANLISRTAITDVKSTCSFGEKSMTVDLKVAFDGVIGPQSALRNGNFNYPFFVAVTAPNGDILAKEVFSAPLSFDGGLTRSTYHESLRQIIPVYNPEQGPRYKVLVGFQLTPEQLAYNRLVIEKQKEAARLAAEAAKKAAQNAKQPVVIKEQTTTTITTPGPAPTPAPVGAPVVLVPPQ
jgi:hypothetical protein